MGCPDWPKCFGKYIPPTNESQLPTNYRTNYEEEQLKKNTRFAKVLNALGYKSLAAKVKDNNIQNLQQENFNVAKTWTEYINRLIGAATGILLLITAYYSFYYIKKSISITIFSLINLILVAFQGWLGSIVVSTNLVPWIVTVHMLLALLILAISIYTFHKAKLFQKGISVKAKLPIIIVTFLALSCDIIQIIIGTEVREKIDEYALKLSGDFRQEWVDGAEKILYSHKHLALAIIVLNVVLYLIVKKNFIKKSVQQQLMSISFVIIMLQALVGVLLSYWGLPPIAQVAHLLLATLLFGTQFYLLLNLFQSKKDSGERNGLE